MNKSLFSFLLLLVGFLVLCCNPAIKDDALNKVEEADLEKAKFGDDAVFYTSDIESGEAKALGKFLQKAKWFGGDEPTSVKLSKQSDNYVVALVLDGKKLRKSQVALNTMWRLQYTLSRQVFDGEPTRIVIANEDLEETGEATIDPIAEYKPAENCSILYSSTAFKKAQLKSLASVLDDEGYMAYKGQKIILLTKVKDENIVRFVVNQGKVEGDPEAFKPVFFKLLTAIQKDAFDGTATHLYLTSDKSYEDFVTLEQRDEAGIARNTKPANAIDSLPTITYDPDLSELTGLRGNK